MVLFAVGCATPRGALEAEGARCESFVELDARVREQLDALLAEAPGEALVRESSRLNGSRRACARRVVAGLLERREAQGLEAVQQELDALAGTYGEDGVRALLVEAHGEEARTLEPLLLEARTKTARRAAAGGLAQRDEAERKRLEVALPESMGPPPEVPETMCDAPTPCEQLACVVEHPTASPELAARRCLDALAGVSAQRRAEGLARVLALLPDAPGPSRTEARMQLETLQRQRWPEVERAVAAQRPGGAAQVATPFGVLPSVSARVRALREAARAHHLARAREFAATPDAAWLHRALAADFAGEAAPPLEGRGAWAPLRWRCKADAPELPELPELPAGLSATLTVKCATDAAKQESKRDDAMRTFELESSLRGQRVEGTLAVSCADRTSAYALRVEEPGVEGFPTEALRQELQRLLERARSDCGQHHALAATRSCTELRKRTAAEVTARFVDHARFTGKWEPCFGEWLEATEGVSPPKVPASTSEAP